MIPREKLLETLKRHWGYERFRPLQLETIEDVCAGRDTLVLMPTGRRQVGRLSGTRLGFGGRMRRCDASYRAEE